MCRAARSSSRAGAAHARHAYDREQGHGHIDPPTRLSTQAAGVSNKKQLSFTLAIAIGLRRPMPVPVQVEHAKLSTDRSRALQEPHVISASVLVLQLAGISIGATRLDTNSVVLVVTSGKIYDKYHQRSSGKYKRYNNNKPPGREVQCIFSKGNVCFFGRFSHVTPKKSAPAAGRPFSRVFSSTFLLVYMGPPELTAKCATG
jgi:hypothetical protein